MADANVLTRGGLPYPVALEVARQMTAGAGNGSADKLIRIGVPPMQAAEIAGQINAAAFSSHKLAVAGVNPSVADLLKKHSGL